MDLTPQDIDIVILSHLHWDHAGGSVRNLDGQTELCFPNARHITHQLEWEDSLQPDERTASVYFPERLTAIEQAGKLELVSTERHDVCDGVSVVRIGGHTRGQLGVHIESQGQKLIYYADNFPSCHHLKVPYVSATDLYPLETQRCKRETLPKSLRGRLADRHGSRHRVQSRPTQIRRPEVHLRKGSVTQAPDFCHSDESRILLWLVGFQCLKLSCRAEINRVGTPDQMNSSPLPQGEGKG